MKVLVSGEYDGLLGRFFQSSFPLIATTKAKDQLELLTQILVGSKDLRYDSMPPPENLVVIRQTISLATRLGLPIPILVPWGGRKMDKKLPLDVAEVFALKQLLRVDECVRKVYAPGLLIRVRIEDINAKWLYKEDTGIEEYSDGLQKLIEILKGDTKIIGVRESEMMDTDKYMELAAQYSVLLNGTITALEEYPGLNVDDVPEYKELVSMGWKGRLDKEQRDYYLKRYAKMYPGLPLSAHIEKLADYFAGSKVRYDLNGRGNPVTDVGSFIQINFSHPVPGAPDGIFNNTLYYRTVPRSMGRTHIAPWRSKGYLQLSENEVISKIAYPGSEIYGLETKKVQLCKDNEDEGVIVQTDYTYGLSMAEAMAYTMPIMI